MYANLIREHREKLGVNQGELVDMLQAAGLIVTRAAVSHWETGRNLSPFDNARDILILARILKIDLQDIFNISIEDNTIRTYSNMARDAARIVETLPEDVQQTALEQIKSLAKLYSGKRPSDSEAGRTK